MIGDNQLEAIIRLNPQVQLLRRVSIFSHLDEATLGELARKMAIKRWQGGSIIVGERELAPSLFIVYHGTVKLVLFGENGREMTLSTLGPADFFGEEVLLDSRPRIANAVAIDDAVVLVLPRDAFLAHLHANAGTSLRLLTSMASRLRSSAEVIGNLALHDVSSRLTRTLITLAEERGEQSQDGILLRYRPTQQDLANMVGTCRETVSRALSSMARRGLVVARGRSLLLRRELVESVRKAA